ncbi:hypothetical protein BDW59DRAFT_39249 [Aspergillus cavernicola]|uniref:Complex 1 LYR protein domain-containing protein n=1 Tax=Aspergillus cavernicola TaxID=176166 RepID=A0ABR4IM86_9EURO
MHRAIAPKLSSAHRFACLALYRALLRQCNELPKTAPQLTAAQSHIRERFRKYKNLQSPSQTANSLKAGYEALDLLYSASRGNEQDSDLIEAILSESKSAKWHKQRLQAALPKKPITQPSPKQIQIQENKRFQEMTARRHPDTRPILSRPRPVVSGRRHVPVLVNARGVPFLRIKKPQPKNLSCALRTKLDRRWKMIERRDKMLSEVRLGKAEDYWDSLTAGEEKVTWASAAETAWDDARCWIQKTDRKNKALAESMWKVVLAERKLAEKEKQKPAET